MNCAPLKLIQAVTIGKAALILNYPFVNICQISLHTSIQNILHTTKLSIFAHFTKKILMRTSLQSIFAHLNANYF